MAQAQPPRTVPSTWSNAGRATGNSFVDAARATAVGWKATSQTITPYDARRPGPYVRTPGAAVYDFCLPLEHAALNLLPEVRTAAEQRFRDQRITWHRGIDGGLTTHLLSSQVQCANALGQMVVDAERIREAFGNVLDIAQILPIEGSDLLAFEWVPTIDVLGEGKGGSLARGRGNTSPDAAFRFETSRGVQALALVEWKFTESYGRTRAEQTESDTIRSARYQHLVEAADGPIDPTVLPFVDLLDEPFYQLMRQQVMADQLENHAAETAQEVHVVHVVPALNEAYQTSLVRGSHRDVGDTVDDVWGRLNRRPQRYHRLDSEVFLDPTITSAEYVERYTIGLG